VSEEAPSRRRLSVSARAFRRAEGGGGRAPSVGAALAAGGNSPKPSGKSLSSNIKPFLKTSFSGKTTESSSISEGAPRADSGSEGALRADRALRADSGGTLSVSLGRGSPFRSFKISMRVVSDCMMMESAFDMFLRKAAVFGKRRHRPPSDPSGCFSSIL
jgi:hypothetical protein